MTDSLNKADRSRKRTPQLWALAFVAAMFGTGIISRIIELGSLASMLVMIPPLMLLIPMIRSLERHGVESGCYSPAMRRYNRRFLTASLFYVAALFAAMTLDNHFDLSGPALWLIALLPTVPIMAMIWTMARLLIEETDEYLRMRAVNAALFATGFLLVIATLWGFLETFGVVPHVWTWAAFPVWALGLGVGQMASRARA